MNNPTNNDLGQYQNPKYGSEDEATNNDSPDHEFMNSNYYRGDNAPLCRLCNRTKEQHNDSPDVQADILATGSEMVDKNFDAMLYKSEASWICPACIGNIPATETIVGQVEWLCKKHKLELDGYLTEVLDAGNTTDDRANAEPKRELAPQQGPESTKLDIDELVR